MSGDFGPHITLPAVLKFHQQYPEVDLILVGNREDLQASPLRNTVSSLLNTCTFIDAYDVISMEEKPSSALRNGKNSSLYIAINAVAEGRADACVSAGNTGAMMAIGRYLLGTLPGIDRPAIATALPTRKGTSYVLDLGANTDCTADNLLQFALMGSVLAEAAAGVDSPKIGLLNIGKEAVKGNDLVKQSHSLMEHNPHLNFSGFVEGDDIYEGVVDVVVCDGFVGNVVLKSSEGLSRLVTSTLDNTFKSSLYGKLIGWMAKPVLNEVKRVLDPGRRNGASFLGLQGTVVKSHGGAEETNFLYAIEQAYKEAQQDIPSRLDCKLSALSIDTSADADTNASS